MCWSVGTVRQAFLSIITLGLIKSGRVNFTYTNITYRTSCFYDLKIAKHDIRASEAADHNKTAQQTAACVLVKRSELLNTSRDSIKIMLDDTLETALWDTAHSVLWLIITGACVCHRIFHSVVRQNFES